MALGWAYVDTPLLTAAYWGVVALYIAAFWIPKFPPLVDYPQHLGVAAVLRRWLTPGSPERDLFDVNLLTYNGGFHVAVALLAFVVPVETAGRIVLSTIPVLFGVSGLALMRAAQRPRWYGLFILPLTLNCMVTWGFINNVLSYGVAIPAFAWLYRAMQGERSRNLYRRGAVAGIVVAYLHIFGSFVLAATVGLSALHRLATSRGPWALRIASFAKPCLALLPGVLLSGFFVWHNRSSSYANWENGLLDGTDDYAWRKVVHFPSLTIGNFGDASDNYFFIFLLVLIAVQYLPGLAKTRGHAALRFLAVFFFILYLITPRILFATWFIFERLPFVFLGFFAAAAPVARPEIARFFRPVVALVALFTAGNACVRHARIPDEKDADAILDQIPEGAKVQGLMFDPAPWPTLLRATWVHFQSYHLARRRGESSLSFLFIESLPVHYKESRRPPRQTAGTEWSPSGYSLDSDYAKYFTTVLVLAPRDTPDPTDLVFGADAPNVRLLGREGRFWLYDAQPAIAARAGISEPE